MQTSSVTQVFEFWESFDVLAFHLGLERPPVGLREPHLLTGWRTPLVKVWKECGSSVGTAMNISKLLFTSGYNEGLWDLSFSLRKISVSTEEITWWTGEGRERPGLFKRSFKAVQAYWLCVFQNEFHSQLECLVSAGPIDFIHYP